MTKKKNGIFSKIKSKLSKNEDESEFEDEIYEDIEDELLESTGEVSIDPELFEEIDDDPEDKLNLPPHIEEDIAQDVTFSDEQAEDDIEELLNNNKSSEQYIQDVEEDDEEEFTVSELKISSEEKAALNKLDTLEDDDSQDQSDYEEELYEEPKPSPAKRFLNFLAEIKERVPSKGSLSIGERSNKNNDEDGANVSSNKFSLSNVTWSSIIDRIFSPDSRHDIHKVFLAIMILGTAYFGGKLIATGVSSKLESKVTKNRTPSIPYSPAKRVIVSRIEQSNLFNTKDPNTSDAPVIKKPKLNENLVCKTSNRKSQLGIKLVNTVVLQDSVKSVASVQVRGQTKILDIREGEKINNDAQIGKIDRLRLVLKNLKTGDCEYVESDSKEPTIKTPIRVVSPSQGKSLLNKYKDSRIQNVGNTFKIQKKVRDEMLGNISEVLTQARAIQIKNPDGSLAFKMTEIVPGSIYSKLNIQEGDTITAINGKKFSSLNEIMNLFGKIKDIDQFELSVKRDGSTQNLEYNFE